MIFSFPDAPIWFMKWVKTNHMDNIYDRLPRPVNLKNDFELKKSAVEYFTQIGIHSWHNIDDNYLWFDINENDSIWTFEILRG